MIDKRAIEIALEHGWDDTNHAFATDGAVDTDFCMRVGSWCYDFRTVALDPTFWQSLGKSLGWEKKVVIRHGTVIGNFCTPCTIEHPRGECFKEMGFGMDYLDPYVYYAHRFYDLILTGGDTQAFWDDLLGK